MSGILGQQAPGATSLVTLYTCPAGKVATLRILVTERGGAAATFRAALRAGGAAISNEHYVAYDKSIDANDVSSTIAFMVSGGDVVSVYSSSANLSFTATGDERDA